MPSEKYLQEQAQRPGWKENVCLCEPRTLGQNGQPFPLIQRSKAMFVLVRPGRGGFPLRLSAGCKGRVTWVGFRDLCFHSMNCSELSIEINAALLILPECSRILAMYVPRVRDTYMSGPKRVEAY